MAGENNCDPRPPSAPAQQCDDKASQPPVVSTRNNVVLGFLGTAFVGVVALTSPFVYMQLRSPLPYMATPRHKIEAAIRAISARRRNARTERRGDFSGTNATNVATGQQQISVGAPSQSMSGAASNSSRQQIHNLKNAQQNCERLRFVDLGSGDGTAVFTAASQGWLATGMELNPTLWFLSSLRRLPQPRDVRIRSALIWGDMFARSEVLRKADCVMVFGVTPLMPQIAQMVQKECRPGTYIMSYRFRLPLLVAEAAERTISDNPKGHKSCGIDASLIYDNEEMRVYEINGSS